MIEETAAADDADPELDKSGELETGALEEELSIGRLDVLMKGPEVEEVALVI